jgi:hypothetical protein
MPVPQVSHRNWERIRGLCQIHMGTTEVRADELTFAERLETVIQRNYSEVSEDEYLADWGPDGVVAVIDLEARDRAHRPEVPEELVEEVAEDAQFYSRAPTDSLPFDRHLDIILERAEEWLETLNSSLMAEQNAKVVQNTGKKVID